MRIYIQSPGERAIKLRFPTRLLFNGLTAKIGAASINKYVPTDTLKLSSDDLKRLMEELNRIKHKFPGLELVNVEAKDGERVIIRL